MANAHHINTPPTLRPYSRGLQISMQVHKKYLFEVSSGFCKFLGAPFNCIFNQSECTARQRCIVIGQMFGKLVLLCPPNFLYVSIILHNIFENPINVITPLHIWWLCAELYLRTCISAISQWDKIISLGSLLVSWIRFVCHQNSLKLALN